MKQRSYQDEAQAYHDAVWAQLMRGAMSRRFVIKAGTLAALGGASALNALIAACAGGARQEEISAKELEAGAFKYSRYPHVEKYNWRSLPWGEKPYLDGKMVLPKAPPAHWDFTRAYVSHVTPSMMQNLLRLGYNPASNPDFTYEIPYLELDLADKVTAARDFSYYDYHLRPNTYFHDIPPVSGRLCTADDVAYSLESLRTTGFQTAPLEIVERFEVIDKETVRAVMKRPANWLNYVLVSPDYAIFAREHYEGNQQYWKDQPIGTGPFMITYSEYQKSLTAVRHPRYNRPIAQYAGYTLPFLREWEGRFLDATAAKSGFRSKQLDVWTGSGSAEEFQDMLATNADAIIQVIAPTATYQRLELNMKNPLFQDVRVRRALNMALDRPKMVDLLHGGMASPSHPVSYQFLGRTDPLQWDELDQWHRYNPAKAKELLAEAGYPNGFEMEIITTSPVANLWVVAKDYLAAIGVRLVFKELESVVVTANRTNRTYKDAIPGVDHVSQHGVRQALQEFMPDSPKNAGNINDPVLTDLIGKAAYSLDADEQLRLLKQINDYAMDQCFALETFSGFQMILKQPWLHNMAQAPSGFMIHTGGWQFGVAWLDDTAPAERKGRLKA